MTQFQALSRVSKTKTSNPGTLAKRASYQIRLNSCHCDRREAIATISEMIEIASFHFVPFAMTDYN